MGGGGGGGGREGGKGAERGKGEEKRRQLNEEDKKIGMEQVEDLVWTESNFIRSLHVRYFCDIITA